MEESMSNLLEVNNDMPALIIGGDCGAIYKDKKNIILDLRSNQGGNAAYPASFLYKLYSKKRIKNNNKLISLMNNWFVYSFSDRENII